MGRILHQVAAEPTITLIKSRRRIALPKAETTPTRTRLQGFATGEMGFRGHCKAAILNRSCPALPPEADIDRESKGHAWLQVHAYFEVASGSIPLFLIVSEARAEARNSISRFEPAMSPEPATTAAENV
jgi:hypothetical protein